MRFSIDQKVTAYELVNSLSEEQLADIIYRYGEERRARRIAKAVVEARKVKPLETTDELADLVARTVGYRGRIHPATRVFQALRIATNRELDNLQEALPRIFQVVKRVKACCNFIPLFGRSHREAVLQNLGRRGQRLASDKESGKAFSRRN